MSTNYNVTRIKKQTMKKLSNYKKQKISENLEYFFNKVSEYDYNDGLVWYQSANDIVQNLSNKYNFKPIR